MPELPARTKGKVERSFYTSRSTSCGIEVKDLSEFSLKLSSYTEKVNGTIHSTLKEIPMNGSKGKGFS